MTIVLFGALAVALVASAYALAREMRLRKALEKLLQIILSRWRAHVSTIDAKEVGSVDRDVHPDERL
jgi:hypothetical protein